MISTRREWLHRVESSRAFQGAEMDQEVRKAITSESAERGAQNLFVPTAQ